MSRLKVRNSRRVLEETKQTIRLPIFPSQAQTVTLHDWRYGPTMRENRVREENSILQCLVEGLLRHNESLKRELLDEEGGYLGESADAYFLKMA
jgi:hypothetical protein